MSARRISNIPEACRQIASAAAEHGMRVYTVGGAVRNSLLGLEAADYDLCGPQSAEDMEACASGDIVVTDTVNGLGTARVRCAGQSFEYTAFRADSYRPGGAHTPSEVVFTTSIDVDAARRDFTVNALYADPLTGEVLDPLGTAMADLEAGILRQAHDDAMHEDALRILRMVRFSAQLGFQPDEATYEAARRHVSDLTSISAERIRDELFLILLSDVPYGKIGAPARGILMLRDLGALEYVIPELKAGDGFVQKTKFHRYDVLGHQVATCAAAPPDLTTRLAALLHDVAKPEVFVEDGNMHRHAQVGQMRVQTILKRLHAPRTMIRQVSELVRWHMFDLDNTAKKKTIRRWILRMGPEQYARLADLREADFVGSGMGNTAKSADKWRQVLRDMLTESAPLRVRDLAINGDDLMRELKMSPGPQIGSILDGLLVLAAQRPSRNTYNCLLNYAKMLKDGAPEVPCRQEGRIRTEDHKGV